MAKTLAATKGSSRLLACSRQVPNDDAYPCRPCHPQVQSSASACQASASGLRNSITSFETALSPWLFYFSLAFTHIIPKTAIFAPLLLLLLLLLQFLFLYYCCHCLSVLSSFSQTAMPEPKVTAAMPSSKALCASTWEAMPTPGSYLFAARNVMTCHDMI